MILSKDYLIPIRTYEGLGIGLDIFFATIILFLIWYAIRRRIIIQRLVKVNQELTEENNKLKQEFSRYILHVDKKMESLQKQILALQKKLGRKTK